jgi:hypothetical protein
VLARNGEGTQLGCTALGVRVPVCDEGLDSLAVAEDAAELVALIVAVMDGVPVSVRGAGVPLAQCSAGGLGTTSPAGRQGSATPLAA